MGRSKRKGSRIERELVSLHRAEGISARRVPLSGAAAATFGADLAGDVVIDLPQGGELRAEVKARANGEGFKTLEKWLGSKDLLFLRRDRAEPLVLMPFALYVSLLKGSKAKTEANGPEWFF